MKKYKTKDINYTGCHPVIAEALKQGKQILCELWDGPKTPMKTKKEYVIGYDAGSDLKYVCLGEFVYEQAEPIAVNLKVKKYSEIAKELEERGFIVTRLGVWVNDAAGEMYNSYRFGECGREPSSNYDWPDWMLEEV